MRKKPRFLDFLFRPASGRCSRTARCAAAGSPRIRASCAVFAKTDIIHRGADVQFLIPYGYGADADGQYARAVCTVLDRSGHRDTAIAAPILEELPQHAADPDLLLRAVLTGNVLYAALADMRTAGPAGHPDVGGADAARGADIRSPPAAEIV